MENINPIVSYFVSQGMPLETVKLLLMLPIIVTLIAFFRQVIGIKAFGIYTPAIVTFAFLAFQQLRYGVLVFVSVILLGMIMRFVLKELRILYLPRVAITLSVIAIAILVLLGFGGAMQRTGLASISIFPILIMVTLVEKFVATQIEKGNKAAVILAVETLVISIAGYYLASWPLLIKSVVAFPWIVLFTIPINIALGKWGGLRISEYFRFRQVLKNIK
ncbi:MAG TPA: 7TM domain-containing protein [Candidatus Moranbacteria bacterium]|nr:7TM domain-containing protein [Candidatus Moranbacteria bacterium]HRY27990.1 7TM domain-containing protein [Candidatus Moranbacteria bacterium]HSA08194.1 7TM domain-containing protein [Candidatus Moranbacteria bacterium]